MFDTFQGDTVSKAKLKQRAADLEVHPDEAMACVEVFVQSLVTAELATENNDQVTLVSSQVSEEAKGTTGGSNEQRPSEDNEGHSESELEVLDDKINNEDKSSLNGTQSKVGPRAVFNVNVTLDSSLVIEKLQKQLDLLRRFGAI
jgi:hypothetical protein